ncbi:hypothetical protein KGQ64_11155, partial [bacterium]|nr:hypothetical protein [bacterium]
LAAGFGIVRRPSLRLRRATSRLLVASGALLLATYAGTSWLRPAGLDLGALRDRVAATGLEPSGWPLSLAALGLGMRWLFPLSPAGATAATSDGEKRPVEISGPDGDLGTTGSRWGW